MKKLILSLILFSATRLFAIEPSQQSFVDNNMAFGLELYEHFNKEGNLFFAPYGLTSAFAILYLGSKGDTEKQIERVLHFPSDQKVLHQVLSNINKELFFTDSKLTLRMANRLWVQDQFNILKQFTDQAAQYYQTQVAAVNFVTKKEEAVEHINQWVVEETQGKILNFLEASQLTPTTKIVLIDILYFKAGWLFPFNKEASKEAEFTVDEKTVFKATYMHQLGKFHYLSDPSFSLLELPYADQKGNGLSCFILLPKETHSIKELEKQISTSFLYDALNRMQPKHVEIFIPKFQIENKLVLNDPLKKLGLTLPFNAAANFSGINGKLDLYLSQLLQQTYIKIDEDGTEAAAATGAVMGTKSAPAEEKAELFKANRPFFFFIQDKKTKMVLFFGRLVKPTVAT